jgi:hypothetical protein
MPEDANSSLIVHPSSGLARVGLRDGRIVAEMVSEALALSQASRNDASPALSLNQSLAEMPTETWQVILRSLPISTRMALAPHPHEAQIRIVSEALARQSQP